MTLVKGQGICDFCGNGNQHTDFQCWWCRRYICDKCESERITVFNGYEQLNCCIICNEEKKKYEEKKQKLADEYSKNRRELEEKFLNSRLELNPKYKGTNTKWRDIAWSE